MVPPPSSSAPLTPHAAGTLLSPGLAQPRALAPSQEAANPQDCLSAALVTAGSGGARSSTCFF